MFNQIIDFFKHKEWEFTQIKGSTIAILGISGKNGKFQCVADVREEEKKLVFLSICGANAPENKKIEICELLTRLNFGKFLGNFEMDYEDGEIRYKTSIYWGNLLLDNDILDNLVMTNVITMDTSLPSILKVIYSDMTPSDAYNLVDTEK
jgi:hypothetical protein